MADTTHGRARLPKRQTGIVVIEGITGNIQQEEEVGRKASSHRP
jgi:hypothetical protein